MKSYSDNACQRGGEEGKIVKRALDCFDCGRAYILAISCRMTKCLALALFIRTSPCQVCPDTCKMQYDLRHGEGAMSIWTYMACFWRANEVWLGLMNSIIQHPMGVWAVCNAVAWGKTLIRYLNATLIFCKSYRTNEDDRMFDKAYLWMGQK